LIGASSEFGKQAIFMQQQRFVEAELENKQIPNNNV
jgi:hypothetical protein